MPSNIEENKYKYDIIFILMKVQNNTDVFGASFLYKCTYNTITKYLDKIVGFYKIKKLYTKRCTIRNYIKYNQIISIRTQYPNHNLGK